MIDKTENILNALDIQAKGIIEIEKDKVYKKQNTKKILYVTTVSRTVNAFLISHIGTLINEGHTVDIACCIDKKIDNRLIEKGTQVFNIPFSRNPLGINNMKAFKKLLKIQEEKQYEVIHVHTPIASIYGRLLKVKYPKIKTIYTAHGYHFLKGGPKSGWLIYYPIEKIMAKLTDVTININKEDFEITKNKLKPKECYLIHGVGIDTTVYKKLSDEEIRNKRNKLGFDEDDFIVIMIAELNKNKNHIQLIKAMELLIDDYPKIKAICVGEGNLLSKLEEEIQMRKLVNNIKFLGFRTDINDLINISNIGILLSHREGLPRSIMEIIANEKKVIGTDIRGIRDLISNAEIGRLVQVGDYKKVMEYIKEYYEEISCNDFIMFSKDVIDKYDMKVIEEKIKQLI